MESPSPSFTDLPSDIHLNILSFLPPSSISAVACTSRRFSPLPTSPSLWLAMCDRRWGRFTSPGSWAAPNCGSASRRLYNALDKWENLMGFWRRIGHGHGSGGAHAARYPLVFFEWNENSITGFRVSPCNEPGSYDVVKSPFVSLGMSKDGETVCYRWFEEGESETDLGLDPIAVNVSFVGPNHLVVEEGNRGFGSEIEENLEVQLGIQSSSPPDQATLEMYQYFANLTSPSGEKGFRKQKRREKGRRKSLFETEHFVKIGQYCPSSFRPLQGLWKGISENRSLEFYLVAYDDLGGITCRHISNPGSQFSGYSPLFWSPNADFLIPPFSKEELDIYTSRVHTGDFNLNNYDFEGRLVSRILCINSSYNLVIPDLVEGHNGNLRDVEGRIWEYDDGSFGFGFVRDDFVIDLKRVAFEGRILDSVQTKFANL
ncbi:hypothetical protein LUZ60_004639 [Juncus effusus]|nr:hypothetical protein LUZ60_004639 [Juncus effusus]